MIQRIAKAGTQFRRTLEYDLRPDRLPEMVGTNMAGEHPAELAAEFGEIQRLRDDIAKPVFQASLSLAPGEHLATGRWHALCRGYLDGLGYGNAPWVAIRHRNTALDHVHLVASRIDFAGRAIPGFREVRRGSEIVAQLSRSFELASVAATHGERAPTRRELACFELSGQVGLKHRLAAHIQIAARERPTMAQFFERLHAQGIDVRLRRGTDDLPQGISFGLDGVACRGGALGREMTWGGLQRGLGIRYEPERDAAAVAGLEGRPIARRKSSLTGPATPPVPGGEAGDASLVTRYRAQVSRLVEEELAGRRAALESRHDRLGARIASVQQWLGERDRDAFELAARARNLERALPELLRGRRRPLSELCGLIRRGDFERAAQWLSATHVELPRRAHSRGRAARASAQPILTATLRELTELAALRSRVVADSAQRPLEARRLARAEHLERQVRERWALLPQPAALVRDLDVAWRRLSQTLGPWVGRAALAPAKLALRLTGPDAGLDHGR